MKDDEVLTPVMGDGKYVATLPEFGGLSIRGRQPEDRAHAREGLAVQGREVPAQLHALLAAPHADHLPRHQPVVCGMDVTPKAGRDVARNCTQGRAGHTVFPAGARHARHAMIANRPDWTLSAPAAVGRADAVLRSP